MLFKKTKNKEKQRLGKAQPDFYDGKPEPVDFIAPSMIAEKLPGELTDEGVKLSDYVVEVGGTMIPVRYFRSFFAEIMGGNTWGGILDSLLTGSFGDGDMDLAIHVRPVANDRELQEIDRRINGLLSDRDNEPSSSKRDAMTDEIRDLKMKQNRIRRNVERSFRIAIQATASATNYKALRRYCNSLVARFSGKSIVLKSMDGRQLDALKAIIPTAEPTSAPKEHFLSFETSNVADLYPFGCGSLSHKTGLVLGVDSLGRPVWLERWHPSFTNKHMVIIGRSGAGKTYAVMEITNRGIPLGIKSAVVDYKGDWEDNVLINRGIYLKLGAHSVHRLNVYDVDITEEANHRYVDIESAVSFVQAVAFKMIRIYDEKLLTGEVKIFINQAIREQYREAGISTDPESLYERGQGDDGIFYSQKIKPMPELIGLWKKMSESSKKAVQDAADMIKMFTRAGDAPSYSVFDGQSTVTGIHQSPLIGIGVNKLDKEIMRPLGLFVAQRWLDEKWAKKDPSVKKSMILEEIQHLLYDEHMGAQFVESSYRELRSSNTSVVAVTQGLEVFGKNDAGLAVLKNSPIKIIGIQEKVDIQSVAGTLNLSEGESSFVVNRATRGNLLVKLDHESAIVKFETSPYEHMMFTDDPDDPAYHERKEILRQMYGERVG